MKHRSPILLRACAAIAIVLTVVLVPRTVLAGKRAPAPVPAPIPMEQRELMPDLDWREWYRAASGHWASAYFGAYAIEPHGRQLYLGLGTARPGESDGALLARYEDDTVTPVFRPSEQGFLEMLTHHDTIYFPGPDPCCPDGWDYGNTYAHDPATDTTRKNRTMPNVFHTWGLWPGAGPRELYAAVSSHNGDYGDSFGQVMHTDDGGVSWSVLADHTDGLGQYRTYDVHGVGDRLYVVWNDVYELPCGLAVGDTAAQGWQRVPDVEVVCRTRLLDYKRQLVALRADRGALYTLNHLGKVTELPFDGFVAADWAYNYAVNVDDKGLFVLTDDGRIMGSTNLKVWRELAHLGPPLITLAYWPEARSLVAARRGADAALWQVPLGKR